MTSVLLFASFYSLIITNILILIIAFLVIKNFKSIIKMGFYKQITMLCVMTIAFGNNGLLHALFEPTKPLSLFY